jgi:hypothetical protein
MTVAATSPPGIAVEKLVALIAACPAFRLRCGVTTSAGALNFISYPTLDSRRQEEFPYAVCFLPREGSHENYRAGYGGGFTPMFNRGSILLRLGDKIGEYDDLGDEEVDFTNFEGAVIAYLKSVSGVSDNLNIVDINQTMAPTYSDPTKVSGDKGQRPYYEVEYLIQWDQL